MFCLTPCESVFENWVQPWQFAVRLKKTRISFVFTGLLWHSTTDLIILFNCFFPSTHINLCLLFSLVQLLWKNSQSWIFYWYVVDAVVCLLFQYDKNDYKTRHNGVTWLWFCVTLFFSFFFSCLSACLSGLIYERIATVFRCKWKNHVLMSFALKNSLGKVIY